MADISSITTNYLADASETFNDNLSGSISAGATTVPVNDGSAYTAGDRVVLTVDPGTNDEATFAGIKDTGDQFINCVWTEGNLSADHSAGASVIDYIAATHQKLTKKFLDQEHDEDGAHADITATSLTVAGNTAISGGTLTIGKQFDGWTDTEETWTFTSFSAPVGVIAVPTGATTKYSAGMKIRITQSTGGTKYGIITKVDSATAIRVYFGTDYTLNNETISSPYYSTQKVPFGFPASPDKWTITTTGTSDRSTTSTSFATLTDNIVVPIGAWQIRLSAFVDNTNASATGRQVYVTLSSNASSETNPQTTIISGYSNSSATLALLRVNMASHTNVLLTSATTFTMMGKVSSTSTTLTVLGSTIQPTVIRATCAYL